jgi:hypothetical protein
MPAPIISEICAAGGIVRVEARLAGRDRVICQRNVAVIPVVPRVRQAGEAIPIAPVPARAAKGVNVTADMTAPPIGLNPSQVVAAAKAAIGESVGPTGAEAAGTAHTKTTAQSVTAPEATTKAVRAAQATAPEATTKAMATAAAEATTTAEAAAATAMATTAEAAAATAMAATAATASHKDHRIIARAVSGARGLSHRRLCGTDRQRRA